MIPESFSERYPNLSAALMSMKATAADTLPSRAAGPRLRSRAKYWRRIKLEIRSGKY